MYGACCWCQILMKLDFCRQIVEKCSDIKFMKVRAVGAELLQYRRTEGRTDMTKLMV
jgi:hypothetical protein